MTNLALALLLLSQSTITACTTYRKTLTKELPIGSEPPGAIVQVDGDEVGMTPLTLEVDYRQIFKRDDTAGRVAMGIILYPLCFLFGFIGAIGNLDVGILPYPFTAYSALALHGDWDKCSAGYEGDILTFVAEKEGFHNIAKHIDTSVDDSITFLLTGSIPARVTVESVPPGATVFLDDQRAGRTPFRKNLAINYIDGRRIPVRIRAELAGYSPSPFQGFIEQTDTTFRIIFNRLD